MTSRSEQWRLSLTRQVRAAAVTMFGTAGTFFAIVRRDSISSTHLQNLSSSSFISLSIDTARRTHTVANLLTAQFDWTAPKALEDGVS